MTLELWIALGVANYIAAVAPGQNVALVGSATAKMGGLGGLAAVFGILIADFVWCVLALTLAIGANQLNPDLMLIVQIASGVLLLCFGVKMISQSSQGVSDNKERSKVGYTKMVLQGFVLGFVNPITLVFFLSFFQAFVPAQTQSVEIGMLLFFASSVLVTSFAALLPYILASFALSKAGLGRALNVMSGGALALVGGLVLVQSAV